MPTLLTLEALEADRVYILRQLRETPASAWGTLRSMWESRLADVDEKIAALGASRSNLASVALVFDGTPVIGSGDIRLDFATSALESYQRVINLAVATELFDQLPRHGRVPGTEQSRLFIRDIVHGSMGFVLEELPSNQTELLPTVLKIAVEQTTRLIETLQTSEEKKFEETLSTTQPRLVGAVQRFAKILAEHGASTRILGDENKLVLSTNDVTQLAARLNEVDIREDQRVVQGTLLGILPESLQFELKPPGDVPTETGTVTDELALRYATNVAFANSIIMRRVVAQIKTVHTYRRGTLIRSQSVLEHVAPAKDQDQLLIER